MFATLQPFDLIIQPGWNNSGPRHWQSHWQRRLGARRVDNADWTHPLLDDWLDGLDAALDRCVKPALVIAHSLGCIAVAHYARQRPERIAGALLVAPADVERAFVPAELMNFAPVPRQALPFPAKIVASSNDPFCKTARAARLAGYWQAPITWLQHAGHINVDSGHQQWEEGWPLLRQLAWRAQRHLESRTVATAIG
ncbi:alpha/beta hydrolase [Chromobacterium piscinae]|uniref:Alpha/beta hydrolase n=1 Tax=Chromobacterium piscinae TaxID=686831 RepID=A0ABV0H982_9NEIS|nr:alpha/beta hydrolase [Chromobacterium piscinae]MBX9296683.1 alpha/beta hydrolase [Chromobacterium vaccinii]MBX9348079.1 alpha/beta hydrolase [Chromobacterium vaccinii]MBX9356801.1 alpha/beta hydrolase [Chromobacterium vaccinii]MCD4503735.1 alpha/beta hydrolase [Chromobacterium piscinae]MCD5329037.1 alpha/beta hydrolase [Chromobacterium piscinae]